MSNELLFLVQSLFVGGAITLASRINKEALMTLICVQCVLANFFVLKQTTLFGFNATCSDAFTIGATLGLNTLQERWGKGSARATVWINFFVLVFYALASQIHLAYIPHPADQTQQHFAPLLFFVPRIAVASFIVYLISQTIDYQLFAFFKRVLSNSFFTTRSLCSASISQLVDTVLFTFIGLYGLVDNPWEVIAVSYAVKIGTMALVALLA